MKSQKKVLFISPQPFFEWRGSPIRVKFNLLALEKSGYQVDFLTLPIGADEPSVKSSVIRAWNPFKAKSISIGPSPLKLWFDLILLVQGVGLVLRNRYDILHGTEEAGFLCYLLSFICRAKCVYEKHSDSDSYQASGTKKLLLGAYTSVEKLTIKRADLVICTGPGLEEQARGFSSTQTIACIPDIPSSTVETTPEQARQKREFLLNHRPFDSSDHDAVVLTTYVGSFAKYQGVDIIFQAIPMVVRKNPNIRFVIIGGNIDEIREHQTKLDEAGVGKSVLFLGKIAPDELPSYLSASDILLAPRKSGINSPLKILDYFKAGGAIVATNTVANQRLLNSENAELCDFDTDSFSQSILKLGEDAVRRVHIAENGHKLYQSTYNFTAFTEQLEQAYQTLNP